MSYAKINDLPVAVFFTFFIWLLRHRLIMKSLCRVLMLQANMTSAAIIPADILIGRTYRL
ncbi:MAG: hypothetical protein J7L10_02150 [Methanomicrobia archaeon]|nr:hypothetical protein [Methanomicrobia archaeon]